jgi:hypothetical protein
MQTVFNAAQLELLRARMNRERPAVPTHEDLDSILEAVSFAAGAMNTGMAIRWRLADGREEVRFLNPVVARHLVACILQMGEAAGWLNSLGEFIFPPLPKSDA